PVFLRRASTSGTAGPDASVTNPRTAPCGCCAAAGDVSSHRMRVATGTTIRLMVLRSSGRARRWTAESRRNTPAPAGLLIPPDGRPVQKWRISRTNTKSRSVRSPSVSGPLPVNNPPDSSHDRSSRRLMEKIARRNAIAFGRIGDAEDPQPPGLARQRAIDGRDEVDVAGVESRLKSAVRHAAADERVAADANSPARRSTPSPPSTDLPG